MIKIKITIMIRPQKVLFTGNSELLLVVNVRRIPLNFEPVNDHKYFYMD